MFAEGTLLVAQEGLRGGLHRWLKDVGLERFIEKYPVELLVRWGWLVPQSRVLFPADFFTSWENYPELDSPTNSDHESYWLLWDSTWVASPEHGKQWPLHPFFRTGNKEASILAGGAHFVASETPEPIEHPDGTLIRPYADFFFHWQAYALIDVILAADCIEPILFTPDVIQRAEGVVRVAEQLVEYNPPSQILEIETRWGGLQRVMTWISHYRSFDAALDDYHQDGQRISVGDRRNRRKEGAVLLALELGVTAKLLEDEIENRLLVLADRWMNWPSRRDHWFAKALPYLQKDISLAVGWLCYLTGESYETYLKKWSHKGPLPNRWAQLSDVLPWEFWKERRRFLQLAPVYLQKAALALPLHLGLDQAGLESKVDVLRRSNYPFRSFMGAFKSLHDHLSRQSFSRTGPDFRDLRPLDHYSLMALRAEGVLQYTIDHLDPPEVAKKHHGLEGYIELLATRRQLRAELVAYFKMQCKQGVTKLHDKPTDPIGAIRQLQGALDPGDLSVAKAFLCCALARNYFAHQYYLDGEQLPKSEGSAFMLGSILATVLLLASPTS